MAKDSPMITAGKSWYEKVESLGQKIFKKKNCQTAPTSPHVV